MKIRKFGHCCLLIEEKGTRILTDPGIFSAGQEKAKGIDIILITHEHADHFHVPSLKKCLENNPNATVLTNSAVGKQLHEENIKHELLEHGQKTREKGTLLEGFGELHAQIHKSIPRSTNTGYFIAGKLFYPGDALFVPPKKARVLALPTAGPWLKLGEAIDYAMEVKAEKNFPVHDALLKTPERVNTMIENLLRPAGITFVPLNAGEEKEF